MYVALFQNCGQSSIHFYVISINPYLHHIHLKKCEMKMSTWHYWTSTMIRRLILIGCNMGHTIVSCKSGLHLGFLIQTSVNEIASLFFVEEYFWVVVQTCQPVPDLEGIMGIGVGKTQTWVKMTGLKNDNDTGDVLDFLSIWTDKTLTKRWLNPGLCIRELRKLWQMFIYF